MIPLSPDEVQTLGLTLKLAGLTALILILIATPLAWWLSVTRARARVLVEAVTALPLVLPPTVLGFYLLLLFSPTAPVGRLWLQVTGGTLTFSFAGLVIASVIYSLPFAVQPLQAAFEAVGEAPMEAAAMLGAGRLDAFLTVASPLALRGYVTALVLSFAHTLGEFGVVLMVGGNIPGRTKVISVAIYEKVETIDYAAAERMSLLMLVLAFVMLVAVYGLNRWNPWGGR